MGQKPSSRQGGRRPGGRRGCPYRCHRLKYRDIFERLAELLEKKTYAIETGRREEADAALPPVQ
jgi:hypothetical protein